MRGTMKYLMATAVVLLGASVQAHAQTVRLTAVLSGSNETPNIIVTGATGTAEVFVNLATQEVSYTVQVFNLPSGATGGHFHVGGPGAGGPVVVDLAQAAQRLERLHAARFG
ncbi:MAG TPA: CHRD domain-containing protein, partial [Vicinamibacterales bacterium]|nr:CHRD domain-containing protein [Vicinamibacterales bacterium]